VIELPIEFVGDWDPYRVRDITQECGLQVITVGAMAAGRNLIRATESQIEATQQYLIECLRISAIVQSPTLAGPFYSETGRTWQSNREERKADYACLREALIPVLEHAERENVVLAIEPLNRYETSLINTVEQLAESLGPLMGDFLGMALDTFHMNIEEKSIDLAIRQAGRHLAHLQVCGNDRGAVGDDHFDWRSLWLSLDEVGYSGPVCVESFTSENETIATAASIWRPLAKTQDDLARDSLDKLRSLEQG
jgi:D-psicose/D-tagatose/L-ribulose 3-epimerase